MKRGLRKTKKSSRKGAKAQSYSKTLGQIAYEADPRGGIDNFGAWKKAPRIVQEIHERMAKAVAMVAVSRASTIYRSQLCASAPLREESSRGAR